MFAEKIIRISNVDKSGSDVYSRYQYQLACVFATFLTLYKTTNDFYILLDYLDDYVIIQSDENNKELITFIQVKTKNDGPFTLYTVFKNQWFLKQAKNHLNFLDENIRNILQTNFGIKVSNTTFNSEKLVPLVDLEDNNYLQKIKDEINQITGINDLSDYYVIKSKLTLDDFSNQLRGLLDEYIADNGYTKLTHDSITTIYRKIWSVLEEKQKNIVDVAEARVLDKIIEKKAVKYSSIQEIFKTMMDIQLPEEGKISSFVHNNRLFLDTFDISNLGKIFRDFRRETVRNNFSVVRESWSYLKDNNERIDYADTFQLSKSIFNLISENAIVNTTEFFKQYHICISILFTYKLSEY